ncbi:MAG: poly(R)-hydroxyalkanoic acid synthase subunit PhaE [Nitrincola lacisaponensis]|uniref:poly(R)-hydroxyalkanoic acid synthase subunit PhaE n=1 Tax=Nitrincola lacisaponensis TaxID=267850 RepID=UPI00391B8F09
MTDDLQATIRRWLELFPAHTDPAEMPDWTELMQQLQQTGWKHLPQQHAELLAVMTQESIEFTRFASQLISQYQQQEQPELASFFNDFHQHINRLTDDWILKRWQLPEQMGALLRTRAFQDETWLEPPWLKGLNHLLETPSTELHHAQQKALQDMLQLLNTHQQALQHYADQYARINTQALNQLSQQIESTDQQISSLRQLHQLWVDAYEHSYAERLATEEYQLAHGRISNSMMQLRLWIQTQRNQQLKHLGIATEASLNLAFEKIHQLSKQVRQLQQQQQQTLTLQQDLNALRASLNNIQEDTP